MATLNLALTTCTPEGILNIEKMNLPRIEGVRYVVSWQSHESYAIPASLSERDDIEIHRFEGRGLSRNRNNAISHCSGDIILFADDDLVYYKDGLLGVMRAFEERPDMDVATFRSAHGDMGRFPQDECELQHPLPKGYSVTSFEFAFRRNTAGNLRCVPEMGLGASCVQSGEDEIILQSAIRRGKNCRYIPLTICSHPHESTGTKAQYPVGTMRGMGCTIALTYGYGAILRVPLKAWRIWREGRATLFKALYYTLNGAFKAPGMKRKYKEYMW